MLILFAEYMFLFAFLLAPSAGFAAGFAASALTEKKRHAQRNTAHVAKFIHRSSPPSLPDFPVDNEDFTFIFCLRKENRPSLFVANIVIFL
jgi:hypothetical protein